MVDVSWTTIHAMATIVDATGCLMGAALSRKICAMATIVGATGCLTGAVLSRKICATATTVDATGCLMDAVLLLGPTNALGFHGSGGRKLSLVQKLIGWLIRHPSAQFRSRCLPTNRYSFA